MAKAQALVVGWAAPSRRRWAQLLCVLQAGVRVVLALCVPSALRPRICKQTRPTCPPGPVLHGWQPIVYSKTAARLLKAAWCLLRIATPYAVLRRLTEVAVRPAARRLSWI